MKTQGTGGTAPLIRQHPDYVTLGERAPSTHRLGCWVCPRNGLDAVKKRKNRLPLMEMEQNTYSSDLQPVAIRCTE
jgi:hypothetical protein